MKHPGIYAWVLCFVLELLLFLKSQQCINCCHGNILFSWRELGKLFSKDNVPSFYIITEAVKQQIIRRYFQYVAHLNKCVQTRLSRATLNVANMYWTDVHRIGQLF